MRDDESTEQAVARASRVSVENCQWDFRGVFLTWELDFFQTQRVSALEVPSRTSGSTCLDRGQRPAVTGLAGDSLMRFCA